MASNTPQVSNGTLNQTDAASIELNSPAWYAWLEDLATRSFYFKDGSDTFTARKERRQGSWYWYAYRRHAGKLHSAYIGKSNELNEPRLSEIAHSLIKSDQVKEHKEGKETNKETKVETSTLGSVSVPAPANPLANLNPLLTTKLYIPPARSKSVPRLRLSNKLDMMLQMARCRLILITAPPGFGKTTLLSEWLLHNHIPAAWISLEESDDDPVRFWNYGLTALGSLLKESGNEDNLPVYSLQIPSLENFLIGIINRLENITQDFALVLDDYHLIQNQDILKGIQFVLEHLPLKMHLVIVSRSVPVLPLARWRVRNELIEIDATDLRFTTEETTAFLNEVMGLTLNDKAIAALETRTEGWVAGLQLAGLSLQGRDVQNTNNFIESLTHTHRFVLDYLAEEVLALQSPDVQSFLLETSILDSLGADLCQAVTGRPDCQSMLEWLERSNLFVTPLDAEHHWYRYHGLFLEFLRTYLRSHRPEIIVDLHRRASIWYEHNNQIQDAVSHRLSAQDYNEVADLIEKFAENLLMQGEDPTLRSWFDQLPPSLVAERPFLGIQYAWTLVRTNQTTQIEQLLKNVERAIGVNLSEDANFEPAHEPVREPARNVATIPARRMKTQYVMAELLAIRAAVASNQRDVANTIQLGQQALELLPAKHRLKAVIGLDLGYAYFLAGNLSAAMQAFEETVKVAQAVGDASTQIVGSIQLGVLNARQSHLHQAARLYQQALQMATTQDGRPMPNADGVHFNLAMVFYEWNALEACAEHILKCIEVCHISANMEMEIEANLLLARVRQAQQRGDEIPRLLQRLDELLRRYDLTWYIRSMQARRVRLYLTQNQIEAAISWSEQADLDANDSLTALNKQAVEYIVLASVWIVQRRLVPAQQLLQRLLEAAQSGGYRSREIWIVVLQSLAYQAQGEYNLALSTLEKALQFGEPEGYLRVFADEGQPMQTLFNRYMENYNTRKTQPVSLPYLLKVKGALQSQNGQIAPAEVANPLVEPLSKRELEVLRMLASPQHANPVIAQTLTLTAGTVKIHIKNIYKKLDVHSRQEALNRAKELKLI